MDGFDLLATATTIIVVIAFLRRENRLKRELSRLRVIAGEFTETDIEIIFRHAIALERSGDGERAARLFQLVETHSADNDNVRLARESLQRIVRSSNQGGR